MSDKKITLQLKPKMKRMVMAKHLAECDDYIYNNIIKLVYDDCMRELRFRTRYEKAFLKELDWLKQIVIGSGFVGGIIYYTIEEHGASIYDYEHTYEIDTDLYDPNIVHSVDSAQEMYSVLLDNHKSRFTDCLL